MTDRETFKANYTGIFDADRYFDYCKAVEQNEKRFKGATYNDTANKRMLRRANTEAFNYYMRGGKKDPDSWSPNLMTY